MNEIVERARDMHASAADSCDPAYNRILLEMAAEIERLTAALQAMLDMHGKPHREEWLNDAAFEHAKRVDAQAHRALEGRKK